MLKKGDMKGATWLLAYEDANVDTGLAAGMQNRAQIGKGMWAKPSDMAEMLEPPNPGHPAGRRDLCLGAVADRRHPALDALLRRQRRRPPGGDPGPGAAHRRGAHDDPAALSGELTEDEIQTELDNNCQSILGYVVRWVGQGVGCSTVPDIDDVGLMEDLATLRISSAARRQLAASRARRRRTQVREAMQRMAVAVDGQNADDTAYEAMATDYDASIPFQAALSLVLDGRVQKNGYTEAILRDHRRRQKAVHAG